jgi:hypothetical protein
MIVSFYGILLSVIKSRRMGVAGHVASTGRRMLTKEKTAWVDLDVNKMKLNWMLMKPDGSVWAGFIGFRIWISDVLL